MEIAISINGVVRDLFGKIKQVHIKKKKCKHNKYDHFLSNIKICKLN